MFSFDFKLSDKRMLFLSKLNLFTPFQVINYFPRRYESFFADPQLNSDLDQKRVVIKGIVVEKERLIRIRRGLSRFSFKVNTGTDVIKVIVFNRDFFYRNVTVDNKILVAGKYNHFKQEIAASDMFVKDIDKIGIRPIYSLIQGVSDYEFKGVVDKSFDQIHNENKLKEILPPSLKSKYKLTNRHEAYRDAHAPQSMEAITQAYRYLKYEELLVYAIGVQKLKKLNLVVKANGAKKIDEGLMTSVIKKLPFELTGDQHKAVLEIVKDLKGQTTMYRLLQGDVGSGKTVVALLGLVANYSAGYQGVFMAPTDILSRQHFANFIDLLKTFNIRVELLVSNLETTKKQNVIKAIKSGEVDIVIGTHALIQEAINFKNLGLAVIDEQHRFGVNQRKLLREKGEDVELLLMSATPIPRTLAISIYGDMDVSTLALADFQKRKITTKVIEGNDISKVSDNLEKVLAANQKAFVIASLIEGEGKSFATAVKLFDEFKKKYQNVYLLHGKMNEEEKLSVMNQFKKTEAGILVSTTVVEVGIDIKEASMMIIYDANRFGLAQLHQLRGRVGRKGQAGFCYLLSNDTSEEGLTRLKFLEKEDDGFEIARFDLSLRGPGDIKGYAQSGQISFNTCNIFDDFKIFEVARQDAINILQNQDNIEFLPIIKFAEDELAKDIAVID
jgi:ATP-dependent DNA helicase RecG